MPKRRHLSHLNKVFMIHKTGLPSLMPVMNAKQQLSAIHADFGAAEINEVLSTLAIWKEKQFFDELSAISWLLTFSDPQQIPADLHTRLPASRISLCIPEAMCAERDNHTRLKHFASNGFRIYTDEFASKTELAWADTKQIALDCRNGVPFFAKGWTGRLGAAQHWAKNISTPNVLEQAQQAGFKWFSGEYAFQPPVLNKTADGSARTRLLKLLGLVSRDADSDELEELFKQDASLSFMLFKLVSSAAFAQTMRVSSFGQAINLLGRRQLQRWLQLLLYARQQDQAGGLNPLMARAAFRASMMENLCLRLGGSKDDLDGAFMVGMFSLLDKLFGSELPEILQPLCLEQHILDALLERSGQLGLCLRLIECADRPQGPLLTETLQLLELDADAYYDSVLRAYIWVNQVCRDM